MIVVSILASFGVAIAGEIGQSDMMLPGKVNVSLVYIFRGFPLNFSPCHSLWQQRCARQKITTPNCFRVLENQIRRIPLGMGLDLPSLVVPS